jgi:hypothetical protein
MFAGSFRSVVGGKLVAHRSRLRQTGYGVGKVLDGSSTIENVVQQVFTFQIELKRS